MEDELELIFPSKEYKEQIEEFKEEFIQNNENNIPGGGGLEREETFEAWMQKINDDLSEEKSKARGRVPSVLYLAFRKQDQRLIGIIQIRCKLNDYLLNFGGHIGDSIRPSERNKGYSTKMIALALKEARELGIGNVLMTCNKNNLASARTIIKNGGKLENEVIEDNKIVQRYWITLKKRYADGRNKANHILESDFKNLRIDNDEFKGNISLLTIKKVRKEWRIDVEQRCILANNYNWLEIYPDGENYCITTMFDENDNIAEWYFDIAKELGEENGIPYEDDLYLDVVIVPDGRIHILDEDELKSAYDRKEVSKEEYEMAYRVANKIIEKGKNKKYLDELTKFTTKYLKILRGDKDVL